MVASPDNLGAHGIHAKGLAALMKVNHAPINGLHGVGQGFFEQFRVSEVNNYTCTRKLLLSMIIYSWTQCSLSPIYAAPAAALGTC